MINVRFVIVPPRHRTEATAGYVGNDIAGEMLELLIEEGEAKLAEIKRRVIQ